MAIKSYNSVPPPEQQQQQQQQQQHEAATAATPAPAPAPAPTSTPDIESWTQQALESLTISPSGRGTGIVSLVIPLDSPLDDNESARLTKPKLKLGAASVSVKPRREPMPRDSQRRREALLRGKEGSRRRQRWENDHLLHVPNAQPPLPSDWEVHATHTVQKVPYFLAPLWDAGLRQRVEAAAAAAAAASTGASPSSSSPSRGKVPAELRQKLKRARGARGLLQGLEEEVRAFVVREREAAEREKAKAKAQAKGPEGAGRDSDVMSLGSEEEGDDEEEEEEEEGESSEEDDQIVFVGRDGTMREGGSGGGRAAEERRRIMTRRRRKQQQEEEQVRQVERRVEREKLIFDALASDRGAAFGRWLVHSIADYYGLSSRSVTVGNPARREAYVGIRQMKTGGCGGGREVDDLVEMTLPRPLWGLI